MPWRVRPDSYFDELHAALGNAPRPGPPSPESVEKTAKRLDAMLAAASENFDRLDRKAALVPAAVAAIFTFMAAQSFNPAMNSWARWSGIGAAILGIVAAFLAVAAFATARYRVGPNALRMALKTTGDEDAQLRADQGVVDSLAVAVVMAEEVMLVKGQRLNTALWAAVGATILLAVFVGLGGVQLVSQEDSQGSTPSSPESNPASAEPSATLAEPSSPASGEPVLIPSGDGSGWTPENMGASWTREAEGWTSEEMGHASAAKADPDIFREFVNGSDDEA